MNIPVIIYVSEFRRKKLLVGWVNWLVWIATYHVICQMLSQFHSNERRSQRIRGTRDRRVVGGEPSRITPQAIIAVSRPVETWHQPYGISLYIENCRIECKMDYCARIINCRLCSRNDRNCLS